MGKLVYWHIKTPPQKRVFAYEQKFDCKYTILIGRIVLLFYHILRLVKTNYNLRQIRQTLIIRANALTSRPVRRSAGEDAWT